MSAPHLPFEITSKILSNLIGTTVKIQDTPNPDLLPCSLISRAWVAPVRHFMWNSVYFIAPSTEERFSEFKTLCTSQYCTLQLDKIEHLWVTDPQSVALSSFLEAFQARLPNIRNVRVRSVPDSPSVAPIRPELITALGFWSPRTLELHSANFHSIDNFLSLLSSLDNLESLSCNNVRLLEHGVQNKMLNAPQIRRLQVDVTLFFTLFSRVTLNNLNELILDDDPALSKSKSRMSPAPSWSDIRDILSQTKDLERLTLRLFGSLEAYWPSHITDITALDLKNNPKLKELGLYIGDSNRSFRPYRIIVGGVLRFQEPHRTLSTLKLPMLPDDVSQFDRTLQRSMPNLKVFRFTTELPGEAENDDMDSEELEEASTREFQSVRERGEAFLEKLEKSMPWCAERNCLRPVFVTDKEGVEAFMWAQSC
ncbi:hypothetical protein VNI00_004268 [Paramarasmius palmivorus]|uniref:F-box domain-containing protein n=1 Tax=Paramarasmius palmivorus TaxID=297713 RepID=A0AAW0DN06_9AGAR